MLTRREKIKILKLAKKNIELDVSKGLCIAIQTAASNIKPEICLKIAEKGILSSIPELKDVCIKANAYFRDFYWWSPFNKEIRYDVIDETIKRIRKSFLTCPIILFKRGE